MPPYQFGNPANDFYLRQAQQLSQQYPFQQPVQHISQQQAPQLPQFVTRFVGNIEEAKAAMTDAFSTYIFVDQNTGRIYLKRISNNGLSEFYTYEIADTNKEMKPDPLNEINARLLNIEHFIGEIKNDKSVSGNVEPAAVPSATVTGPHESNGAAESNSVPKVAGNGWRKK